MRQKLRKLAEPITWFGIIVQYGVALVFLYFTVTIPPWEIKIVLAGLTFALLSTATANLYYFRQSKYYFRQSNKIDEILKKLEEISKQTGHSPVGETLATIVDYLIKRKTGDKK